MTTVIIQDCSPTSVPTPESARPCAGSTGDFDPLPVTEDEPVSLEAFKTHMEDLARTRLGINMTL